MILSVFSDAAEQPTDDQVKAALGPAWEYFGVLRRLAASCEQEWRHYGKKYGWKLRVHADDKVLFEVAVAEGLFVVALSLREQERLALKADTTNEWATRSPEGYVKLEVRDAVSSERASALVRFLMAQRELGER
ncbi:MAG TPA: DUF3788 family protein [Archangium sp.]